MVDKKKSTIKDVAALADVSIGVVSRVLNPGTGSVSERTRQRIIAAMQTLSYTPQSAARELKTSLNNTIGLVVADISNEFFSEISDLIVRRARELAMNVILVTTQEDPLLERESLEMLMQKRVKAIIATPTSANKDMWQSISDMGIAIVFIDRYLEDFTRANVIGFNNETSARQATSYLAEQGHRRIGWISGPLNTSTSLQRLEGYKEGLEANGIECNTQLIVVKNFRDPLASQSLDELLSLEDPPTAIIIGNTSIAPVIMSRIRELKLSIPDDLSLIVYHDSHWSRLLSPSISVIKHPLEELANKALLSLSGEQQTPCELDSTLIKRESVSWIK
ncbi:substrate-binding domain-containing protein [Leclercia adecarboxylata]|uniref:LacI family DNA-binding transcriptional regulator n=1 Tax=Leclercia adecarboxylata TaxID=83655 RepID=UPI0013FD9414|nr:substrate-binding domain-containing protein [Leclercia adecarboxylata]QIM42280.1 LacI family transcriptional regulator [Leclercia adecarboxylata]